MHVILKSVDHEKKIQAIKAVRAATGLGLKEAKDLVDDVAAGASTKFSISPYEESALREAAAYGYLNYERAPLDVSLASFVEMLGHYPRNKTVGSLLDVLGPTAIALPEA